MPLKKRNTRFPEFNLVPHDPFYDTILGKVMVWALKVGRYIVIFTELVVIVSFASRFKLDRDLTDLNSSIAQKTAIIKSYADTENRVRSIQKKSELVSKQLKDQASVSLIELVINKIPFDVKLTRLGYKPEEIQLIGQAKSSTSLASLVTTLQREPTFLGLTIDQVQSGDKKDPGYLFIIRIALQNATPPAASATTPKKEEPAI
jgi:Tfp pilus assembly protein PilN